MRKLLLLVFFGVFFLTLSVPQIKAYSNELVYYSGALTTASSFYAYGNANISSQSGNCTTDVSAYAEFNTSGAYQYRFRLYLNDTLMWENNHIGVGNYVCPAPIFLGNVTINSGYVRANLAVLAISSTVPTATWLKITTTCQSNDSNVFVTSENTSYPYNMYGYSWSNTTGYNHASDWLSSPPEFCVKSGKTNPSNATVTWAAYVTYAVPFNSKSGNVTLKWKGSFTCTGQCQLIAGYFDAETGIDQTASHPTGVGSVSINADVSLILPQDRDYVMYLDAGGNSAFFQGIDAHPIIMNATINDYTPDYECGNWTACSGGFQIRTCIDIKGGYPMQIQTRSCLLASETIVLGFEDFISNDVKECNKVWFALPFCSYFVENRTYNNPEDPHWTIIPTNVTHNSIYVATITSSGSEQISAPLGSRFLKMWYMPPFWAEHPLYDSNTSTYSCYNYTSGYPSYTAFEYVNASFFASYDFTFPSPSMHLFWDVRKCPSQQVQFDTGFWCGKACYGNCTAEPKGNYWVILYDVTNATVAFRYDGISISQNWTRNDADVTNIIEDGHTYRLIFGVEPPSGWWTDPDGYCSYFDRVLLYNAEFSTKDQIALDLFGLLYGQLTPEQQAAVDMEYCSVQSECIGNDYYVYTLQGDVCIAQISYNYSVCVQQAQQAAIGNQSIFAPISSIANTVVNSTTNQTLLQSWQAGGYGFLVIFITPIFWLMMLVASMTGVFAWFSKHMEVGIAAGLFTLVAITATFSELIWITIVLIIIAGYILGREVVGAVSGK